MKTHNPKLKKEISILVAKLFSEGINPYLTGIVVDRLLWTATEDSDKHERVKYVGQPYWSKAAIAMYRDNNAGRKTKDFSGLRHEHIVPRSFIRKKIYELDEKTAENINQVLESYSHAVVVTKAEDQRLNEEGLNRALPESFYENDDIFARYAQAAIEVVDVQDRCLKTLTY